MLVVGVGCTTYNTTHQLANQFGGDRLEEANKLNKQKESTKVAE
jgi:chromosome segregation and condensation protein ScpB